MLDALGAGMLAWGVNWLALAPFRKLKDAHWTERARVLYPARVGAAQAVFLWPVIAVLALALLMPETGPHWLLVGLAGWGGAMAGRHPEDEVAAVSAHELGHLSESRLTVWSRVLVQIAWMLPWLFFGPLVDSLGIAGLFAAMLGSVGMLTAARRLSRKLEERADRVAHGQDGDSGAYARALARLYEDNLIPAVLPAKRRTHPDLYDRLLAAGVPPDYPKPKAAKTFTPYAYALLILLGVLVALNMARWFP